MSDTFDVKAVRERCEAATAGPWENLHRLGVVRYFPDQPGRIEQIDWSGPSGQFAAHARTDLPAALDRIAEPEARLLAVSNAYEYRKVEHPTNVLGRIGKALGETT